MRHFSDDEQYSQQLHDKSTQIWTGAAKKRQIVMQNLTPGYSRKYQADNTNQSISGIMDKQVDNIKEKISIQKSASKHKDFQIQNLKEKINQLNKDKQVLMGQIGVIQQQSPEKHQHISENTINFQKTHQNQKSKQSRHMKSHKSQLEESIQQVSQQKLENLPKQKLLELLGSTSQYRAFVDYHDCYKLVFLKQLHDTSKRIHKSQKSSNEEWSESQIMNEMSKLNEKQNLGLSYHNQSSILGRIRQYYEKQYEIRARNMRNQYEVKLKKTIKEVSIIPEDLKEICKIKEGQLAQQMTRNKGKSMKKKEKN